MTQVKQEIERRIKEKCDELDALKKTYQKSIDVSSPGFPSRDEPQ